MLGNRFSVFYTLVLIIFVLPFVLTYMEENLALLLFSFLSLVLIFNAYDAVLDSSRSYILLLTSKFKILYLLSFLGLYFSLLLAFLSKRYFSVTFCPSLFSFVKSSSLPTFLVNSFPNTLSHFFSSTTLSFFNAHSLILFVFPTTFVVSFNFFRRSFYNITYLFLI